jgi:putative nucleotidyltransferase with HDIG domain
MKNMFFPISTKLFGYFKTALPFDVYLERFEGKFTKIYHKNGKHDLNQLDRYESMKVTTLYISIEDKGSYCQFLSNDINSFNHGGLLENKEKIVEVIKTTLELTYERVTDQDDELDSNILWASRQIKGVINLMEDDMVSAIEIFKLLSEDLHLLKHSYLVTIFSLTLAKELNFSNDRNLMGIGLGALFHDIGHTRLNPEIFKKNYLSPKEWDELKDHPQLGLKIIDHSKGIPPDVRSIILQHHEQPNGRGYPNRLSGNKIFPPAKVVSIADGFCSLVSKSSYRDTIFTADQAIEMMRDDIGQYDKEFFETFAQMILKDKKKCA